MPRWKNILVPTDLSPASRAAMLVAAELAHDSQGKLLILHVAELPEGMDRQTPIEPTPGAPPVPIGDCLESSARAELARMAQSARDAAPGATVDPRVVIGAPSAVILAESEALEADLVVVGTHGRTGFAHLMLGSVAENLVRRSRVPVLTVRGPAAPAAKLDPAPSPEAPAVRATFQG